MTLGFYVDEPDPEEELDPEAAGLAEEEFAADDWLERQYEERTELPDDGPTDGYDQAHFSYYHEMGPGDFGDDIGE